MSNLILMSIKTKYANEIFKGTKKYEYRRSSIGNKNCNKKIVIYSAGTDKAIIGYMIVDKILEGNLDYILTKTNNERNNDIKNYFNNAQKCYALHIKETHKFSKTITLSDLRKIDKNIILPQYYRYIKETEPLYKELTMRLNESI